MRLFTPASVHFLPFWFDFSLFFFLEKFLVLVSGFWLLVSGCLLLVGIWLRVPGCGLRVGVDFGSDSHFWPGALVGRCHLMIQQKLILLLSLGLGVNAKNLH